MRDDANTARVNATLDAQTWKPLRMLTFYRVTLAGLLVALFFSLRDASSFGQTYPDVFGITSLAYLLFSIIAGFCARLRIPRYELQAVSQVLIDILAITVLMFASNGPTSGLGILLIIAVATGSILQSGRMAFMFAAVATLALMGEHFYSDWLVDGSRSGNFTQVGLLGLTFFATAALTFLLVRRIHESEALAKRRAIDVVNLGKLNALIVQHLQAGIIVTDGNDNIRLINETASKLLQTPDSHTGQALAAVSPALHDKLLEWKDNPGNEQALLSLGSETDSVLPHFTRFGSDNDPGVLILLEDTAAITRQTQQIRLASLGRLTASIAHEIRNPLGAISHAAQLLQEENTLGDDDRRLMTIIDDNTVRVNEIVENILQLSRPAQSIPQTIRLADWTGKFVEEFIHSGNCQPTQISCSIDPEDMDIRMDPSLLHQVMWNLCQNAVQHAGAGEDVRLRIRAGHVADGQTAYLDIIDNGPGIAAEMRESIFEPFFTTRTTGTGLGLYIAREICESNNTHLEYQPQAGGGSCFRIIFPESQQLPVTALA